MPAASPRSLLLALLLGPLVPARGARKLTRRRPGRLAAGTQDTDVGPPRHERTTLPKGSAKPGAAATKNPWSYDTWKVPSNYRDPLRSGGARSTEEAIMRLVTQKSYTNYEEALTQPSKGSLKVDTRSALNATATAKVVEWLEKEFKATGVTTCTQSFTWKGNLVSNVIGYIPGTESGTVTLGAHFDSIPGRGKAPGAEDNGSGTAGVLAALKAVMQSGARPKKSLYFVGFGGEEYTYGSARFVAALKKSSASPRIPSNCRAPSTSDHAAVIFDMIGWKNPNLSTEFVMIEGKPSRASITNDPIVQSMAVNAPDTVPLWYDEEPCCSDHEPFINAGYPATLIMDTAWFSDYSCYHKSCDTIEKFNAASGVKLVKAGLGGALRLAGLN